MTFIEHTYTAYQAPDRSRNRLALRHKRSCVEFTWTEISQGRSEGDLTSAP